MITANSFRVHDFDIRINGSPLPAEAKRDVVDVAVHQDVEAPGMFTLRLYIWDDKQELHWVDDDRFAEGNEVAIQMGYVDDLATVMVGEITGLEPSFSHNEAFTLAVRGYDRRHRLLRGRKTRTFLGMKDSDIARQIASDAELSAQAIDSGAKLDYVLQFNQTDMEFLQTRAWRIGYEVIVEDKTLHFRPPPIDRPQALTLSLEEDIIEFYPRSSMLSQVGELEARGWDPKKKESFAGKAGAGRERSKMGGSTSGPQMADDTFGKASSAILSQPLFHQQEADTMALGHFNDIALSYISGDGVCHGRHDLRAGTVVKIEGLGERFSGLYYVASTTHTVSPQQTYRTAFTVRRNAT